ncbi:DUF4884 domain-containing protein [Carboxylicivirga linearis]|uniref:DUF4884 domain-containing protein n=1 Tax=Carboxylicivirga linearis TaxID=1628157 RepID=A0ABS5JT50_9BACT|nr:DUF4884 domain-containing protein [Carboxylicivirga linearis]MBS2098022.1 DUF4884 domain-containing protein [Carboxylicivirga linearis]
MKTLLKSGLIICTAFMFHSCSIEQPLTSEPPKNNETYTVEYLFEHDGCKVYRFRDDGNYVYFTNCNGDVTSSKNDTTKTQISNHIKSE